MSNKEITLDQLYVLTSKSRRTIIRITNRLQKEGRLKRIGSTRGGYWEIIS